MSAIHTNIVAGLSPTWPHMGGILFGLELGRCRRIKLQNMAFDESNDRIRWWPSPSGTFSVCITYHFMLVAGKIQFHCKEIWKARVPPSLRIFLALLLKNRLLIQEIMLRRHFNIQQGCSLCQQPILESTMHLFFECPYTSAVWTAVQQHFSFPLFIVDESPMETYMKTHLSVPANSVNRWLICFITALGSVWRERNNRIFRNESLPGFVIADRILQDIKLFQSYC